MLKQSTLVVFLVWVIFAGVVSCIGRYTIVVPRHIRPHSGYEVSLTLHDQPEPVAVLLSILDQNDTNFEIKEKKLLCSDQSELVSLPIGDLIVSHNYKFVAEGVEGLTFKNETWLQIESKNVSLFIQTDKAIYKPTETIKFRILALDSLLRPVVLKKDALLDVFILDSEKNPIKQWRKVDTHKGVFVGELQLSDWSASGHWKIVAQIQNERKAISIEVSEYVLPKFEITIEAPTQFSYKDGKIRAIIRSKSTYGTFVKGKAIVSLTCQKRLTPFLTSPNTSIKTIPVDGKGTVVFDTTDDLRLDFILNACSYDCVLGATVIEELTGRNQSTSKNIAVHLNRYKIVNRNDNHKFDAGLPLTFAFSIKHQDNSPILVNEESKEVFVAKIRYQYEESLETGSFKFLLNSNGTVHVNIPTSREELGFDLIVKYLGEEISACRFHKRRFLEKSDLRVKALTERPMLNHDILVRVESKDEMQNFTYQLVANGKVFRAGKVTVPDRKFHEFQFNATFNMVPNLHLFVYRLVNGWIVHAMTYISIEDELNNYVNLKLSSVQAAPSSDVTITVSSNPNSYVGLLGVDQSSLLHTKNDGLTKEEAFKEMGKYEYQLHAEDPYRYGMTYESTDWGLFEKDSNVILFTNAFQNVWVTRLPYRADPREKWFDYDTDYVNGILGHTRNVRAAGDSSRPLESPRIRSEFPETWLWESIDDIGTNGSALLQRKVPETITSWVISAFSINPVTGLGLTKMPKTLQVFQPFSVSLNLPYSVKRGEIVAVPVLVFNYLEQNVAAELVIHNENNEYEFVNALGVAEKIAERKRIVQIESNNGVAEWILLRFNVVGSIPIKLTATSALAGDGIVRILQVEPEGVPVLVKKAVFVELREQNSFESVQTVEVPENAVPGSIQIIVNVAGDLIGEKISNLHQLVRLPTIRDSEKNLLRMVPNYVILRYFNATGRLTHTIEQDAKRYLLSGYQNQLSYRHPNGSFRSIRGRSRKGSTWLTAFVVKSFVGASQYIDVDESVIEEALSWLNTTQEADGSFQELEPDSHELMQLTPCISERVALTAYTATAFLTRLDPKYENLVRKALDYVVANVKELNDLFALSVSAFALQKAKHPNADTILELLLSKSIVKDQLKWFSSVYSEPNARPSKTSSIEITSYGLLALMEADRLADGLPYFRWLLTNPYDRNDLGGFLGTQDTVIGLIALTNYARHLSTKDNNLELRIKTSEPEDIRINVDNEKALFLQTIELKPHEKSLHFLAHGHGFALAQLSYSYYVNDSDDALAPFILKPKLSPDSSAGHIRVDICATFKPKDDKKIHSTMVVLEVAMPSGFITDEQSLNSLSSTNDVKLIKTKRGETAVDIYIDNMTANKEKCIAVDGYRVYKVAEQKPVVVRMYDYYDSSRSACEFYTMPANTSCDICETDECSKLCKNRK